MMVLITGSTGFVGKNLLSSLAAKNIKHRPISRKELGDISAFQIGKGDCIVHLAGKAHDLRNSSHPEEYYDTNFKLTKLLYDEFIKSEADRFIFISSVKAVADNPEGALTEDYTPDPKTEYGKSKLMAEQYIQDQLLPEGKSWYILRPCMIHGPGNKGNINLLYKFVTNGIPYVFGAFKNRRSFLSIDNLCFVIEDIVQRADIPSGIYNIADDDSISTTELVNIIAKVTGSRVRSWNIHESLVRKLAKIGDVLHLPLTTERLAKLTQNYTVDNSKITRALRKKFPVDVRAGLVKTIKSFNR